MSCFTSGAKHRFNFLLSCLVLSIPRQNQATVQAHTPVKRQTASTATGQSGEGHIYQDNFRTLPKYSQVEGEESVVYPLADRLEADLPVCGVLVGGNPGNTTGKWYIDESGHYIFEPDHCNLRRLSGSEARQCLNQRHLIAIGDSVMRYQYLSLAHLLSKGHYTERYGDGPEPSVCLEAQWDWSWENFYREVPKVLADAVNATGKEACDCMHLDNDDPAHSRETREFTLSHFASSPSDEALTGYLHLSYAQLKSYPTFESAGQKLLNLYLNYMPTVFHTTPDVLLFNMGRWLDPMGRAANPSRDLLHTRVQRLAMFLEQAKIGANFHEQLNPKTRLLWKSVTVTQKDDAIEAAFEEFNSAAVEAFTAAPDWDVFDARAVTQALRDQKLNMYQDPSHYLPLVYEELNDVLLNMLCDENNAFVPHQ